MSFAPTKELHVHFASDPALFRFWRYRCGIFIAAFSFATTSATWTIEGQTISKHFPTRSPLATIIARHRDDASFEYQLERRAFATPMALNYRELRGV